MEYHWSLDDLRSCKNKLWQFYYESSSEEDKAYIRTIIDAASDIISDLSSNSEIPSLSYDQRLGTIEKELVDYSSYYDIIENFIIILDPFERQLNKIENIFKNVIGPHDSYAVVTGATLTNYQAFNIVKKFYSRFDGTLFPTFMGAFDSRSTSVRFVDKISGYNEADSFYFDLVKRYFIQVVKTKDPNKAFSLIHEYGHVLSYILNPKAYLLQKECMYDEVAAVFPELLAYYLNPGNFDELHVDFEKYASLISVYNYANSLALHTAYVDIWKDNRRRANKRFFRMVKKELGEKVEDVDEGLDTYINSCGQYIIAYLVAIELLNVYRKDKNKALEIYRNIIMVPYNQNVHEYIKSELELGSHLEEETALMIDGFEKKLTKVGAFHV
ncbi:MAG TPA: hypothetical protein DCE23_09560 [Firmicutes bacterium]|nr:hypothetical protein [Bacillota bacterium]